MDSLASGLPAEKIRDQPPDNLWKPRCALGNLHVTESKKVPEDEDMPARVKESPPAWTCHGSTKESLERLQIVMRSNP